MKTSAGSTPPLALRGYLGNVPGHRIGVRWSLYASSDRRYCWALPLDPQGRYNGPAFLVDSQQAQERLRRVARFAPRTAGWRKGAALNNAAPFP